MKTMKTMKRQWNRTPASLTLLTLVLAAGCCDGHGQVADAQKPKSAMKSNQASVQVRFLRPDGMPGEIQSVNKVIKTDEEWRKQLTKEQYEVARDKGTERAFCGAFHDHKKPGTYFCVCCDLPLFASNAKFD